MKDAPKVEDVAKKLQENSTTIKQSEQINRKISFNQFSDYIGFNLNKIEVEESNREYQNSGFTHRIESGAHINHNTIPKK